MNSLCESGVCPSGIQGIPAIFLIVGTKSQRKVASESKEGLIWARGLKAHSLKAYGLKAHGLKAHSLKAHSLKAQFEGTVCHRESTRTEASSCSSPTSSARMEKDKCWCPALPPSYSV